jgi:hypothetical protein
MGFRVIGELFLSMNPRGIGLMAEFAEFLSFNFKQEQFAPIVPKNIHPQRYSVKCSQTLLPALVLIISG